MEEKKDPVVPAGETLLDLYAEWRAVMQEIDDAHGELSPEVQARLVTLDVSIPRKIDAWGYVRDQCKAQQAFWRQREDEARAMRKKYEDHEKFMTTRLKGMMFEMGVTKMTGEDTIFQVRDRGEVLEITDEKKAHAPYLIERVEYDIDKKKLEEDLRAGVKLDWARLRQSTALYQLVNSQKAITAGPREKKEKKLVAAKKE